MYGTDDETLDGETTQNNVDTEVDNTSSGTSETNTGETTDAEITEEEASDIKIELVNGTGSNATLREIRKILEDEGYSVSSSNITTITSKTTIINKTDVDSKFTDNIKELLGVGNVSTSTVSSSNVDITILIGKDYND